MTKISDKKVKKKASSKTKKTKQKAGAKSKIDDIDWDDVIYLCTVQCTQEEIAAYLGVCRETLFRAVKKKFGCNFKDFFAKHRKKGFVSIRKKQFEVAVNSNKGEGSEKMLTWLGKNWIGQMDKPEKQIELENQVNMNVREVDASKLSDKAMEEFLKAMDCDKDVDDE